MAQPFLRDFGGWLRNPTLERVSYSRISHPGDKGGPDVGRLARREK